jgi:WD40 repeat protein
MDVAFSPDGERLATAAQDSLVKTWDVRTGEELLVLEGHEAGVNAVAFNPDGRLVATASDDLTVRVWDAGTGRELWALPTSWDGWSVAFSPDGSRLVVGDSEGEIRVWQLPQNPGENPDAVPEELLTFLGNTGWIGTVRFSPDGTRIVGGGTNGLSLWDAESGQLLLRLVDSGATYGASFSPDGTRLATAHRGGAARLFTLDLDELTALARSRLTRSLTEQECQQYLHVDECPPVP